MGHARRFDEAFQIIESVEDGTATGSPMLSARLFYGLLNAILEKGLFMVKTKILVQSACASCTGIPMTKI